MRIAIIHPDLGLGALLALRKRTFSHIFLPPAPLPSPHLILNLPRICQSYNAAAGGAERLIVDAAVELRGRGHDVTLVTAFHDPRRCFEETLEGEAPRGPAAARPAVALLSSPCPSPSSRDVQRAFSERSTRLRAAPRLVASASPASARGARTLS